MTRLPLRRTLWIAALTLLAGCSALTKATEPLFAEFGAKSPATKAMIDKIRALA